MVTKVHGVANASQSVTGALQYYTVWAESTDAFTDPPNATGVNIRTTGDIQDESQKCFEVLVQSIGLRALPVILNNPTAVADLPTAGSTALTGEGFIWKFASEKEGVYATDSDEVGLLVAEINGIVLPNGTTLVTSGVSQNIEFSRSDEL